MSPREKTNAVQWSVVAALVLALLYAPAVVARTVTADSEPVNFLARPWTGWTFTAKVLVESFAAEAASPGSALENAQDEFETAAVKDDDSAVDIDTAAGAQYAATKVKLLYLPGSHKAVLPTLKRDGKHEIQVDPEQSLVWIVYGTRTGSTAEGAIGLVDFESGSLVWDIRSLDGGQSA